MYLDCWTCRTPIAGHQFQACEQAGLVKEDHGFNSSTAKESEDANLSSMQCYPYDIRASMYSICKDPSLSSECGGNYMTLPMRVSTTAGFDTSEDSNA